MTLKALGISRDLRSWTRYIRGSDIDTNSVANVFLVTTRWERDTNISLHNANLVCWKALTFCGRKRYHSSGRSSYGGDC